MLQINELQSNFQNDGLKLIPSHPRPAIFYTIQIFHKLSNLMVSTCPSSNPDNFIIEAKRLNIYLPGRQIASDIGALTEYVSPFDEININLYWRTCLATFMTTDFLNKLSHFGNLTNNNILVTLDVTD